MLIPPNQDPSASAPSFPPALQPPNLNPFLLQLPVNGIPFPSILSYGEMKLSGSSSRISAASPFNIFHLAPSSDHRPALPSPSIDTSHRSKAATGLDCNTKLSGTMQAHAVLMPTSNYCTQKRRLHAFTTSPPDFVITRGTQLDGGTAQGPISSERLVWYVFEG